MLRNAVTSLLNSGKMSTTECRGKEIVRLADKMITLGKRGDLHARRQALAYLTDEAAVHKVFGELAERYRERPGGYVRITKTGYRRGDGSPMVLLELV
jgi:large subunit ribosomal protein L17